MRSQCAATQGIGLGVEPQFCLVAFQNMCSFPVGFKGISPDRFSHFSHEKGKMEVAICSRSEVMGPTLPSSGSVRCFHQNQWDHILGVGEFTTRSLVGIGMFTGGMDWILTQDHVKRGGWVSPRTLCLGVDWVQPRAPCLPGCLR